MHIREYQQWLEQWDKERGWDRALLSHTLLHAVEEMGEVSRHIQAFEGYRELDMLGALESPPQNVSDAEKQKPAPVLSALGRRLARLPLDPALARILFAAHHEKALADALIVVAALECDDPRRRPIEKQTEADKLHARFLSPISDFAAVIRLWRWYHEQTAGTSQSRARRLCKDNFLSYPRLRDWIDLRAQLERLCTELQLNVTATSGGDHGLHRALLTGLLGNLGKRDPEASDYRGARGIRFAIFPGSGLAKLKEPRPTAVGRAASPAAGRRPAVLSRDWILAGELVETSRLFARTAACIDPAWIEPIAKRLCKSSYHSASWDATRGFVRVKERVTLFGLVLVEGRTRDYSRIEPLEARAIFIREGLVAGAFPAPVPPCLTANLARIRTLLDAEEKTRQHGALFDPETAFAFYDTRLPPELCSAADLRRWLRENATASDAMTLTEANLPPVRDLSYAYPDAVTLSGNRLALTYRHAQGEADDGITCTVPAALLTLAAAWRSEWLVPGLLDEKLRWMIHVLPTRYRRLLQPVDETLSMCRSRLTPGHRALAEAFSDALYAVRAVRVPTDNWNEESVPDHLRMRLVVQDEAGRELGSGRNIALLVKLFAPRCEGRGPAVQTPDSRWQKDGLTQWDFGALPAQLDVGKAGWPIIHYPALVDAGDTVSLRLFAAPAEAAAAHDKGVCRLFALALGKEWKRMIQPPSLPREVVAYLKQLDMSAERLGQELSRAALRETFTEGRPPVRDAAAFQERFDAERGRLHGVHLARTRLAVAVLHAARDVERDLLAAALPPDTQEDLAEQLAWLIFPGFAESIPSAQLQHLPRYLEACRVRIQRAQGNPHGDTRKLNELKPLWHRYTSHVALAEPPRHDPVLLAEYRWQIEELRVSLFAQELRTPAPVSAKRLDALWAQVLLP